MTMWIRAGLIWFALLIAAVANGTLREALLTPGLGEHRAHAVSSLTLAAAILLITWAAIGWIAPATPRDAWIVGVVWLGLTVGFELGLGRARGTSWSTLLADYRIWRGRLWPLVLLTTLVAPWLTGRWRNLWPGITP